MWYCQSALDIQKKSKSGLLYLEKKYLVVGTWKMENLN